MLFSSMQYLPIYIWSNTSKKLNYWHSEFQWSRYPVIIVISNQYVKVDIWIPIMFYCNDQEILRFTFTYIRISIEHCLLETYGFYLTINGLSILDIGHTRYYAIITWYWHKPIEAYRRKENSPQWFPSESSSLDPQYFSEQAWLYPLSISYW